MKHMNPTNKMYKTLPFIQTLYQSLHRLCTNPEIKGILRGMITENIRVNTTGALTAPL